MSGLRMKLPTPLVTLLLSVSATTATVFAQRNALVQTDEVFNRVVAAIFVPMYKLIAALAFLYFLYGVAKYIIDINDPEKKNTGKGHLVWGSVGLFIIFSVGGIMWLFSSMFGSLFDMFY